MRTSTVAQPPVVALDHVAFGARSRAAAVNAMELLGFTASAPSRCDWDIGGEHSVADASCVVFAQQYLDLIEITDPKWDQLLTSSALYRRGAAPTGVVLSGIEPEQARAQIADAHPPPPEPYTITRRILAEPSIEIAYRFLPLRGFGFPLGLIADSSPQALRRPTWLAHPNTALGISAVHLRVPSVRTALDSLVRRPLSLSPVRADTSELAVGTTRICLHQQPLDDYLASVSQLLPWLDRPALLALEFRVTSLESAADALRAGAVAFAATSTDLSVDPIEGFGTGIILRRD